MTESLSSETGKVRDKELNGSEPSDEASLAKTGHIKTRIQFGSWDNGRGNLFTVCWVCGVKAARPCLRLSEEREKQAWNAKGKYQARHVEVESTDVCVCGRPLCSSDEVSVMGMERREWRAWRISASNLCEFGGNRKVQLRSIGMKRRMKQ